MVGSTLGHYEITAPLGKGGMGEVWLATDGKLGRQVALKTLPTPFAHDVERLTRLEREARLLASLNHPNIASIFGLEESQGVRFLVLELIEGDTLADRLGRGPLPVEEALRLGLQVAEALEAAHERGVIHRDLKPSNIKLTADGKVKVLDFGLAKAFAGDPAVDLASSPTLSMAATLQGVILGTAAYMSPEQAKGLAVDKRSDLFAFGCVLFEMLSGRRAFEGELVTEILAAVIRGEPEYARLPNGLSPRLLDLLRRCLEKDPKKRWQDAGDLRVELERLLTEPAGATATASGPSNRKDTVRLVLPWAVAAAVLTALVAATAAWALRPAPDPRPVARFHYDLPEGQAFRNTGRPVVAVSPDGRSFVYNTPQGLYLRSMDAIEARLIPGTEPNLMNPFFSPDGQWIGYLSGADLQLRKIAVSGGAPVALASSVTPLFGASWERDGTILFAQPAGIMRVSENGGTPELVVETGDGEQAFAPQLLPDGRTVLFSLATTAGPARWDAANVVAQTIGSGDRQVLVRGGADARYVSSGHLVYALGNVLYTVPFDAARLEVTRGPVPMIQGVQRAIGLANNTGSANWGVTESGTLIYLGEMAGGAAPIRALGLADITSGAVQRLDVPLREYVSPRVSPDGRQLAVQVSGADGRNDIWMYDLSGRSAMRRLTSGGNNVRPIWTPDGSRITFASDREGSMSLYGQAADGSGVAERLTTAEAGTEHYPDAWSPDGQVLAFTVVGSPAGGWGIWTLSRGTGQPELFYDAPNNQFGAVFSPDGKWIAYTDNSETFAVFVQPFPRTGVRYQITQDGEAWPVWSPRGDALYFRPNVLTGQASGQLMMADVSAGSTFAFSNVRSQPVQGVTMVQNYRDYDIMPDGRRFMVVLPGERTERAAPSRPRIQIVLNWTEELKARAPLP